MSWWFDEYGWGPVAPDLATGAYPQDAGDVAALHAAGVTTVLNLCDDHEYAPGARTAVERAYAAAGIVEHRLASEDYGNLAPEVLEEGARVAGAALDAGGRVYVHCRAGWQRSATVVAAALVVRDGLDPSAALAVIAERRPQARPLGHQVSDLRRWWHDR